jgi:hypothetical protein
MAVINACAANVSVKNFSKLYTKIDVVSCLWVKIFPDVFILFLAQLTMLTLYSVHVSGLRV